MGGFITPHYYQFLIVLIIIAMQTFEVTTKDFAHGLTLEYEKTLMTYETRPHVARKISRRAHTWTFRGVFQGWQEVSHQADVFGYDSFISQAQYWDMLKEEEIIYDFQKIPYAFVHNGDENPFCELIVRKSDFIWNGIDEKTICHEHMHNLGCSLISREEVNETRTWLEYTVSIVCIGLKGDASKISKGFDKSWLPIYTSVGTTFSTIAGEPMYVRFNNNTYGWVSPGVLSVGLTMIQDQLRGATINGTTYTHVPLSKFVLGYFKTEKEMVHFMKPMASSVWTPQSGLRALEYYKPTQAKKCTRLLKVIIGGNYIGLYDLNYTDLVYCIGTTIDDLAYGIPNTDRYYDETGTWYQRVFAEVIDSLLGLMHKILSWLEDLSTMINAGDITLFLSTYIFLVRATGWPMALFLSAMTYFIKLKLFA